MLVTPELKFRAPFFFCFTDLISICLFDISLACFLNLRQFISGRQSVSENEYQCSKITLCPHILETTDLIQHIPCLLEKAPLSRKSRGPQPTQPKWIQTNLATKRRDQTDGLIESHKQKSPPPFPGYGTDRTVILESNIKLHKRV